MLKEKIRNPHREQQPEDSVYIESEIEGMLVRFLDLAREKGEGQAIEAYTTYFYKFFCSEFIDFVRNKFNKG